MKRRQFEVRWTQTVERKMRKIVIAETEDEALDIATSDSVGDEEISSKVIEEYNFYAKEN